MLTALPAANGPNFVLGTWGAPAYVVAPSSVVSGTAGLLAATAASNVLPNTNFSSTLAHAILFNPCDGTPNTAPTVSAAAGCVAPSSVAYFEIRIFRNFEISKYFDGYI